MVPSSSYSRENSVVIETATIAGSSSLFGSTTCNTSEPSSVLVVGSLPLMSVAAVSITPPNVGCATVIDGPAFPASHADYLLQMTDVIARALLKQEEVCHPGPNA